MSETDVPPQRNIFRDLTILVLVAILLNVGLVYWLKGGGDQLVEVDHVPLPPVEASGWINGRPPEDLSGKVVVINVWATWCHYCRKDTPNLVKLHEKYGDRVTFIGLTGEGQQHREGIEEYLDKGGVTWPNGYGALETLRTLGVDAFPTLLLVNREGKIVAAASQAKVLEGALKEQLDTL